MMESELFLNEFHHKSVKSQLHRRRGRNPMAALAWEMMPYALDILPSIHSKMQ